MRQRFEQIEVKWLMSGHHSDEHCTVCHRKRKDCVLNGNKDHEMERSLCIFLFICLPLFMLLFWVGSLFMCGGLLSSVTQNLHNR